MADIADVVDRLAARREQRTGPEPDSSSPAWRARASSRTRCRWSSAPSCSSTSAASPSSWPTRGEHAAIDALNAFRNLTRDIATRRGVRIASWLGDGAMLIGTEVGPAIAAAAELIARYDANTLALRGGIADGWALLFDGDDYIGRPVNLAARLEPGRPARRAARRRLPVRDVPVVDAGARHPGPDPAGPRAVPAGPAARARPRHRAPGALVRQRRTVDRPLTRSAGSGVPELVWRRADRGAGRCRRGRRGDPLDVVAVRAVDALDDHAARRAGPGQPVPHDGDLVHPRRDARRRDARARRRGARRGHRRDRAHDQRRRSRSAAVLAAAAAVADAGLFGHPHPVPPAPGERALARRLPAWVYGGGFGFQIGLGFATYIMTLGARPARRAGRAHRRTRSSRSALGTLFGFVRGLGVLPGARLTTPAKLAEFHRRFDARSAVEPPARHRHAARRRGRCRVPRSGASSPAIVRRGRRSCALFAVVGAATGCASPARARATSSSS